MRVLVRVVRVHALVVADNPLHPMNLIDIFSRMDLKTQLIKLPAAGIYHFLRESQNEKSRLHLRIDKDGSGLLIINANRVFQLNPTATAMAYFTLNQVQEKSAVKALQHNFNASKHSIIQDYSQLKTQLDSLIANESCPICELGIETTAPFSTIPSAPYRMDIALTYRCNNACAHCYNGRPRNYPELPTQTWFNILDKLWEIGIPHIVFTGGEPTLREDLPELIKHAEKNGQITGINTNGRRLKDAHYVQELIDAGLDHIQITFESKIPLIHDHMVGHAGAWNETLAGLKNALNSGAFVMTNTTMLTQNQSSIADTLDFLGTLGLKTVGLNALIYSGHGKSVGTGLSESDLLPLLTSAQQITNNYHQRLIWYTPTQYCNFDPVQMDLGVKGCTAGLFNMCVEPDGGVIPCQSYYQTVGNITYDDWDKIWNHELCISLRERKFLPEKCSGCALVNECGGGCPLSAIA